MEPRTRYKVDGEQEDHASIRQGQRNESWSVISNKDSEKTTVELKPGDVVRYRTSSDSEWTRGVITQKTGRSGGNVRNTFNVDKDEGAERINCDKLEVRKLQQTIEEALKSDVFLTKPDEDSPVLKAAKNTELQRFTEFGVFREEQDTGQHAISSRWVISYKGDKCKARLVARGFEDYNYNITDAPTAHKVSKFIFFSLAASYGWKIETLDVVAAFLQADPIERDVWVKPPADIRKTGIVWRLLKPMYGLEDSSRQWYITLKNSLEDLGCVLSKLDKCVFCFYGQGNALQGQFKDCVLL